MIAFDPIIQAQFAKGVTDAFDALTFIFDSGLVSVYLGVGTFSWTDPQLGSQTFLGVAGLLSIEAPAQTVGGESAAVVVRLAETYVPANSDAPVNVFDDGVRASIDDEPWYGRPVILSRFHRSMETGLIVMREQLAVRFMDTMAIDEDEDGRQVRVIGLEREDVIQRDIEGKKANADFQRQVDPTDLAFQHVGKVRNQDVNWGGLATQKVGG